MLNELLNGEQIKGINLTQGFQLGQELGVLMMEWGESIADASGGIFFSIV